MSDLELRRDWRGWLAEFVKSPSFGQVFVSRTKPHVTRGNHWHRAKVEKFLVVEGNAKIRLRRMGGHEIVTYVVSGEEPTVVDIPAGHAHSITNVGNGDLVTVFWADEVFDPEHPDTYSEQVC